MTQAAASAVWRVMELGTDWGWEEVSHCRQALVSHQQQRWDAKMECYTVKKIQRSAGQHTCRRHGPARLQSETCRRDMLHAAQLLRSPTLHVQAVAR